VGTNHIGVTSRGNREITFGEPPRAKTYRPEGWRSLDCRPWGALTALTTEKSNPEPIHGKNKGGESRNRKEAGGPGAEARKLGYGGSLREEAPQDRGNKDEKRPAAGTRRTLEIGLWQLPSARGGPLRSMATPSAKHRSDRRRIARIPRSIIGRTFTPSALRQEGTGREALSGTTKSHRETSIGPSMDWPVVGEEASAMTLERFSPSLSWMARAALWRWRWDS
jgi:hypothetical protein